MAPSRSAHARLTSTLIHFLLCFVIVMQMLGTTTSLWTFDFETGIVAASLQEGFSLTADPIVPTAPLSTSRSGDIATRLRSVLLETHLFRPPHSQRPPMALT
ncbi:MAG TPA: hypothetical protein VLE03_07075 [Nitrospiraceae bacterium]|nr:hypothetical protein [Nitrospiraceae bacterium]